jgi:hypothetical protein
MRDRELASAHSRADYVLLNKRETISRSPKKVLVVTGTQTAEMGSEAPIVFAYEVEHLHLKPELWL